MPDDSAVLGELLEERLARVRAGEAPDVEDYVRRYPHLAQRIRALFSTQLAVEHAAAARSPEPGAIFGKYHLVRDRKSVV